MILVSKFIKEVQNPHLLYPLTSHGLSLSFMTLLPFLLIFVQKILFGYVLVLRGFSTEADLPTTLEDLAVEHGGRRMTSFRLGTKTQMRVMQGERCEGGRLRNETSESTLRKKNVR